MFCFVLFFFRKTKEKRISTYLLTRTRKNHLQEKYCLQRQLKKDRFAFSSYILIYYLSIFFGRKIEPGLYTCSWSFDF